MRIKIEEKGKILTELSKSWNGVFMCFFNKNASYRNDVTVFYAQNIYYPIQDIFVKGIDDSVELSQKDCIKIPKIADYLIGKHMLENGIKFPAGFEGKVCDLSVSIIRKVLSKYRLKFLLAGEDECLRYYLIR